MNFEPLAYDTLTFEQNSARVELSGSVIGDREVLGVVFDRNKKLYSIVSEQLSKFPLFNKVSAEPTGTYHFKIEKSNQPTTHTLQITGSGSSRMLVTVKIEAGARVTIVEQIEHVAYLGYELNIIAGEGSKVDFISAVNNPSMRTVLRNAFMGKDSSIVWHEAVIEGKLVQSHTRTYLYETGASAEVKDLFALSTNTVLDMYHSMYHLASHTKSDMLTKGVLQNNARALYQGLIHIDEKAVGCTGYQKQDSLILSNNAEVNAVPNLEIENSEVKCSHGVTTAHIDAEKLFYAQSRGIDEKTATELFVEGHLSACLDQIKDENVKNNVLERIRRSLINHGSS